jgi:hypothetical protein
MATPIRTLLVYAVGAAAAIAVSADAYPVFAGQLQSIPEPAQGAPVAGWSLTPSLLFSRTYDDNVLLRGPADPTVSDAINVINPKAEATYHGPRSEFSARYDGAFLAYQQSTGLNSFDQHAGINTRRRLSKRNTIFASASAQQSPTTELLQFIGLPYIRVGSFSDDMSVGLDTVVNKRLSFVTSGHFQQVHFDQNAFSTLLFGGYTVGGGVGLRERLTARTSLTVDYDFQHATVGSQEDVFDVQNGTVGIDHQLSEGIHVFAAGGFSRVDVSSFGQTPHVAPSWRLGLSDHYRATVIDVGFSRSYVPSFGYGGTLQNEEATASVKMPITRRVYTQAIASWRREDALVLNAPQLRSFWLQAAVGYSARAWFRVEGYYAATRQTVGGLPLAAPDALMSHDQMGIQLVASKPMRIH